MNVLVVTNLYPLPWEPNRASFNRQQFERLAEKCGVSILVPVAWLDFFKHRQALKEAESERIKYGCFFYTPKMLYGWFGRFMDWSLRLGAHRWLKEQRFDVVLGSWAFPDGYAARNIALRAGKPYVIKVHGSDINLLESGSQRTRATLKTCQGAAQVVAVSDALRHKLVSMGVAEKNITRIYNGVDEQLFYPEPRNGEPYILFVGNLKRDKGVLDLLEAYKAYRARGGNYALHYVGDGPEKVRLKSMIETYGLETHVVLHGALQHSVVAQVIRQSCSLVLPSYHEGVPNVLLEAASCGVPVLATSVGGIPEVVKSEKTGLLSEPGDIRALTDGLLKVTDAARWNAEEIVRHARQFSWPQNVAALQSVIEETVAKS